MRASTPEPFWPTGLQRDLLTVAFDEPEVSAATWIALQRRLDLETLEPGVFALLPLAYRGATRGGLAGGPLDRLKGIVRKTWTVNHLSLAAAAAVARALGGAGIRALFVEGAVFAARFYPELGLRPSPHLDVLIEAPAVDDAVQPLHALGWHGEPTDAPPRLDHRFFLAPDGQRCLVRTRLSVDFTGPEGYRSAQAPLWEAAEALDVRGTELLCTSPTDSLLALCVAHARWGSPSGAQWIADGKMLLAETIDWPRLARLAADGGQTLRLARALSAVASVPGPAPPAEVVASLEGAHVSRRERLIYDCTTGRFSSLGNLPWLVAEHLSEQTGASVARAAASFPVHLRDGWGLAHTWQLPAAASTRTVRRLTRRWRTSAGSS